MKEISVRAGSLFCLWKRNLFSLFVFSFFSFIVFHGIEYYFLAWKFLILSWTFSHNTNIRFHFFLTASNLFFTSGVSFFANTGKRQMRQFFRRIAVSFLFYVFFSIFSVHWFGFFVFLDKYGEKMELKEQGWILYFSIWFFVKKSNSYSISGMTFE